MGRERVNKMVVEIDKNLMAVWLTTSWEVMDYFLGSNGLILGK